MDDKARRKRATQKQVRLRKPKGNPLASVRMAPELQARVAEAGRVLKLEKSALWRELLSRGCDVTIQKDRVTLRIPKALAESLDMVGLRLSNTAGRQLGRVEVLEILLCAGAASVFLAPASSSALDRAAKDTLSRAATFDDKPKGGR